MDCSEDEHTRHIHITFSAIVHFHSFSDVPAICVSGSSAGESRQTETRSLRLYQAVFQTDGKQQACCSMC